jgi:Zn-dependent protease with chaperone function
MVLSIPLIAFLVSNAIKEKYDSDLRSALRKNPSIINKTAINTITIDDICKENVDLGNICFTYSNMKLINYAAIGSGSLGLLLLLLIFFAGKFAQSNRRLLLLLFRPGLNLTIFFLLILICSYALLAIATIYYGESALIHRIHVGIIVGIAIGALAGIGVMARSSLNIVKRAETRVIGNMIARETAPDIWSLIDMVSEKIQSLKPDHLVVGLEPNFFVTEADVICLDGKLTGRTLYCSLPLSRILTKNELLSIIAHELGHFKGLDTKFSEKFYPIYRGTISAISGLHESSDSFSKSLALMPAMAILSYFFECFSLAESKISRHREKIADQEGAKIATKLIFGSALAKVHAFSAFWIELNSEIEKIIEKNKVFVNISKTYAKAIPEFANTEILQEALSKYISHPTDSHPSFKERLSNLGVDISEIYQQALNVASTDSAILLFNDHEKIEESISLSYQQILAHHLGVGDSDNKIISDQDSDSQNRILACDSCGYEVKESDFNSENLFCPTCKNIMAYKVID